jgi:hypothetical protein
MSNTVKQVLEITFVLVLMYLVLSNGTAFNSIVSSIGSVYVNAVKTLQGK